MDENAFVDSCRGQLEIVLSFFPRVDAKLSVVLAIDTAMLGYLATHFPNFFSLRWWEMIAPALAIALMALSFGYIYKGAFPNLKGGNSSLVYFAAIAKRTESKFIEEFLAQDDSACAKELLGQVWRNSEILAEKFRYSKLAFVFMALAILPWLFALIQFATMVRPPQ